MNPIKRLIGTLYRPYPWKRSSHENTDQYMAIKAGDVVECAIEHTDGILYRVESIDLAAGEARIRRLANDGKTDTNEVYTVAPVMLRPLRTSAK